MRIIIIIILTTLSLAAVEWQRADVPGTRLYMSEDIVDYKGKLIIRDRSTLPATFIYENEKWIVLEDGFLDTLNRIYAIEQFEDKMFIGARNGKLYSSDSGKTWENLLDSKIVTGVISSKYILGYNIPRELQRYNLETKEWDFAKFRNDSNKLESFIGNKLLSEGNLIVSSELAAYPLSKPGLKISADGGETWYKSPNFEKSVVTTQIVEGVIYVMATDKKLYFSEDNGMSWQATNAEGLTINELVAYKGNLYSTMNDAVYKSSDKGNTWELFVDGVEDFVIEKIKAVGGKLLLLTERSQLYIYSEENEKWEYQPLLEEKLICDDLRLHRDTLFSLGGNRGILYSTDNGESWSVYSEELNNEALYYWDFKINNELIVLNRNGQYLLISDDSGKSWTISGIGYINPQVPPIGEIELRNDTIILFTAIGIKVSINKGEEWTDYFGGDLSKGEKASSFFQTDYNYYIRNSNGIYTSDGNFNEWQLVLDSLESKEIGMGWIHSFTENGLIYFNSAIVEDSNAVYSYSFDTGEKELFCDYTSKDRAAYFLLKAESSYIMAYGSSVIVSHDEGKNWNAYKLNIFGPDSLRGNHISSLLVKDNRLIVAARNGIAYADLSEFGITTSVENEIEPKNKAYPNPATNTVNIDLTPDQYINTLESEIKVFDVIGNEVSAEGEVSIEDDKVMWNCASKSPGVYFIKIDEEIYKVIKE